MEPREELDAKWKEQCLSRHIKRCRGRFKNISKYVYKGDKHQTVNYSGSSCSDAVPQGCREGLAGEFFLQEFSDVRPFQALLLFFRWNVRDSYLFHMVHSVVFTGWRHFGFTVGKVCHHVTCKNGSITYSNDREIKS